MNACLLIGLRSEETNWIPLFISIAWSISLHRFVTSKRERESAVCVLYLLLIFKKKLCNLIKRWRDLTLQTEFWISKSPVRLKGELFKQYATRYVLKRGYSCFFILFGFLFFANEFVKVKSKNRNVIIS